MSMKQAPTFKIIEIIDFEHNNTTPTPEQLKKIQEVYEVTEIASIHEENPIEHVSVFDLSNIWK